MSNYIGSKCKSCDKIFTTSDDIVVCPDCGTPYHRECYKKNGVCINTELHQSGKSWKSIPESMTDKENIVRCPACGEKNDELTIFCNNCGRPLNIKEGSPRFNNSSPNQQQGQPINPSFIEFQKIISDKYCGMNPEEEIDGVKIKDIADFVGENTYYFLPLFNRMYKTGSKISMNFTSFFFFVYYYIYRRMNLWAILLIVLSSILSVPTIIEFISTGGGINMDFGSLGTFIANNFNIDSSSFQLLAGLFYFLSIALKVFMMLFTNYFYYRHVIKKIKSLKEQNISVEQYNEAIKDIGGVSRRNLIIIVLLPFVISTLVTVVSLLF